MTGTFGSLNIAKTGLQYQQLAMDVASNNISNVNTDGYVRRQLVGSELGSTDVAMWSTSDGHGQGVGVQNVQRLTDQLLDVRVRREHGALSSLLTQQASLGRVETAIGEPSDTGLAHAMSDFKSALQDLATNPDKPATRATVLAKAATLTQAFHSQAQSIADEQGDLAQAATSDVAQVNQDAKQLADLNHAIFVGQASGTDVGALLDQRDQVALDLANRAGAVSTLQSDGRMSVKIGDQDLVAGDSYNTVTTSTVALVPGPGNKVAFQMKTATGGPIVGSDGTTVAPGTDPLAVTSGELGGIAAAYAALTTYNNGLDAVAQQFAQAVNGVQKGGYDLNGAPGASFFAGADPADDATVTASNIAVNLQYDSQIAASTDQSHTDPNDLTSTPVGNFEGTNADAMAKKLDAIKIGDAYQTLVTTLGAQISGLNGNVAGQQAMATQADDAREQQAGVSLDEETINMVAAQHAYEASSRVMTVMDSILDTLINHTGVTA